MTESLGKPECKEKQVKEKYVIESCYTGTKTLSALLKEIIAQEVLRAQNRPEQQAD